MSAAASLTAPDPALAPRLLATLEEMGLPVTLHEAQYALTQNKNNVDHALISMFDEGNREKIPASGMFGVC
jgi:hypothetical protein